MIYQRLPESPKSGGANDRRLVTVGYALLLLAGSVLLFIAYAASSNEVGDVTRTGWIDWSSETTAKDVSLGPLIRHTENALEPVEKIVLLGERHSGTNWITDHLRECFSDSILVTPHYTRFKHWFQKEELYDGPSKSVVVVAMFRDPYDWVWAMKERPHHAHDHIGLEWLNFVTKPWIGERGPHDRNITGDMKNNVTCFSQFKYVDVMPCSQEDSPKKPGYADYKYELLNDGSERAYSSIVNLRAAKIQNHLSAAVFNATREFYPFRYEDLSANGTELLLSLLEMCTGMERKCKASAPKNEVKHKEVPNDYIDWMNSYVDWDIEAKIGYYPREHGV